MIDLEKLKTILDDLNKYQIEGLKRETNEIEQQLKDGGLMAPELVTIGYNLIAKHLEGAIKIIDLSANMSTTLIEAQSFLDDIQHKTRTKNLRLLREFKESDIVIFGGCYGDNYDCDVKITDDYSGFSISSLGKHKESLECGGSVSILSLDEFIEKKIEISDGIEYSLIRNFSGTIHLEVSDGEGKSFDTINLPKDKYLHWECGLVDEDDDDFYPQVNIDLSQNVHIKVFDEKEFESIKLKHQRKNKLNEIC